MRVILGAGVLVGLLGIVATARADVALVRDGQPQAAIYVSAATMVAEDQNLATLKNPAREAESQRQRLRESVKDLAHYLEKMSGAKIEIVNGLPAAGDKRVPILIGELAEKAFGPVGKTFPFRQGFRVVVSDRGVGLFGESDLATSYAIYEVLDRLGCRWFMPSEMGEVIPQLKSIALAEMDLKTAPGTIYRTIIYLDEPYRRRNRMGGLLLYCGQILELTYLTKEEVAAHPEWSATTADGKPIHERYKWSNVAVANALADRINEQLDKDPQASMSLSPADGVNFDESAADKALDAGDWEGTLGTPALTDRLMVLCNRIAERVAAKHPDTLLGVLAYVQFTRPPVREKVHPNLVPQIAPITYSHSHPMNDDAVPFNKELRELIVRWGQLVKMTSYYAFGYHLAEVSAPNPMIARWSNDVPFVLANRCQFWQPETMPNFETTMHAVYLGNRLAFNPSLKPADIVADINQKFYGHAAGPMTEYWTLIDDAWVKTPEYVGCGFGYLRRFPPELMQKARALMNAALAAAQTPQEKFRVELADQSLQLFELFMKMRHDLAEGRFANLTVDGDAWRSRVINLGEKYKDQFCFTKVPWTPKTINGNYFDAFYKATYDDAARIANQCQLLTPGTLRNWKYLFEKDSQQGAAAGYAKPDFDDAAWQTTDVAVQSWSTLGHTYELGSIWYRTRVDLPQIPAGKKVYLWVSSTDGSAKVFVNGQHIPYVSTVEQPDKTKQVVTKDAPDGFCQPFSFDITPAIKSGSNQITILGTKTTMVNELGTGGLLGPVVIYRDRD